MTTDQSGGVRPDGDPDHDESKTTPPSQARRSAASQGNDVVSEFQRWLIRAGARNMRTQISGQVRRTLGGGKTETGDVWGTATTEPPLAEGEAPECQWCPVCRAARRMRESGPGLGDQLLTVSEAVAAAMKDGLRTLDDMFGRPSGSVPPPAPERAGSAADAASWASARDQWAAEHGARPSSGPLDAHAARAQAAEPGAAVDADGAADAESVTSPASVAGQDGITAAGSVSSTEPAAAAAQDLTSEPDGTDEPDDRS